MKLHELQANPGAREQHWRVGRGVGSGFTSMTSSDGAESGIFSVSFGSAVVAYIVVLSFEATNWKLPEF